MHLSNGLVDEVDESADFGEYGGSTGATAWDVSPGDDTNNGGSLDEWATTVTGAGADSTGNWSGTDVADGIEWIWGSSYRCQGVAAFSVGQKVHFDGLECVWHVGEDSAAGAAPSGEDGFAGEGLTGGWEGDGLDQVGVGQWAFQVEEGDVVGVDTAATQRIVLGFY